MKKALSLVLVLSMLLSLVAIAPFASSAAEHTLDQYNVGTEAYKFDGTVEFKEIYGRGVASQGYYRYLDPKTIKTGTSSAKLVIDGVIEEGEWGAPSFTADSAYAASNEGKNAQNINIETPSADNTFFSYDPAIYSNANAAQNVGLKYDVYLMWDEDYLYVAANVYNPDGHGNTQTYSNIWNGDCFQFRVDKDGPNSVVDGTGYNAYYENEEGTNIGLAPWKTSEYKSGAEYKGEIPNIAVAYALSERPSDASKQGTTSVYDSSKRYWPHYEEVQDPENPEVTIQQLVYTGTPANYAAYLKTPATTHGESATAAEVYEKGPIYATAYPTLNANNPYTQYEVAVPWAYVDDADTFLAKEGLELGLTTMVLNAKRGGGEQYAFLEWGNGINLNRQVVHHQTCGGSNSLVLSGTSFDEHVACEHEYAPANCIRPEECTKCGDQRGFKVGHDYEVFDYKLSTESEAGYVKAICLVCEDVHEEVLEARYTSVQKSYYDDAGAVDLNKYGAISTDTTPGYGWGNTWTHHIWTKVTNEDGTTSYETADGSTVYNTDNTAKNLIWTDGQVRPVIVDEVDGANVTIVSEMLNPYGVDVFDFTSTIQTGTYLCVGSIDASRTFAMDVDFWALTPEEDLGHGGGYKEYLALMLGPNARYHAGIFMVEDSVGNLRAFFAIAEGNSRSKDTTLEEFKEACLVYKEVDPEILGIGAPTEGGDNWHKFVYFYDDDACVAMIFWDGELMVAEYDYHFENGSSEVPLQFANMEFCATNIEWGTSSLAAKYVDDLSGKIDVGVETPDTDDSTDTSTDDTSNDDTSNDDTSNDDTSNDDTSNDDTSNDDTSNDDTSNDDTSNDDTSNDDTSNDDTSNDDTSGEPNPDVPPVDPTAPYINATGEEKDGKIYVKYEIANNPGIWSAAIDLSYNADALELESVVNGEIFSADDYVAVDPANGVHRYFANAEDDITTAGNRNGNGVLVEYVFSIKDASKSYGLGVELGRIINIDGQDVEFELVDNLPKKEVFTVTIDGVEQQVAAGEEIKLEADRVPVYDADAECAYVFLNWVVNGEVVADLEYTIVVGEDIVIETEAFVHGDVSGDGVVDSRDKVALQRYLNSDDQYDIAYDITLDGTDVDSRDKVALQRIINDPAAYYGA